MKIIVAQIIPMSPSGCTTCAADVVAFNNAIPAWAAGLTTAQSPITVVDQWTGFDVVRGHLRPRSPASTSGFRKMAERFFPAVTAALNGTPPGPTLTVTQGRRRHGHRDVEPAGINCGSDLQRRTSPSGTSVTLTAAAASGSTFAGWSGACTGTGTCTVSMTQARAVTATFNTAPTTFALAVTRAGTGTGTVTSNPRGINCGTACTANYSSGASVTLTAAAASGSTFAGWSGACTGTGSCTVSMTAGAPVTATFNTSGGTGGTCANPVTFTATSGNFNTTGAVVLSHQRQHRRLGLLQLRRPHA